MQFMALYRDHRLGTAIIYFRGAGARIKIRRREMGDTVQGNAALSKAALVGGTFLVCLSLLAFEVSTVRTINFAIGPSFIFIAIALAMLGLTAAGSVLSAMNLDAVKVRREWWIPARSATLPSL